MALAQTAELAVLLKLNDQMSGGIMAAKTQLGGLEAAAQRTGAGGLARLKTAAAGMGGALSHAGNQLKGLITGPLGMIGLAGGLFTLGGALTSGISKAQAWGTAIGKLTPITGDTSVQLSGLLAVTDRYNISTDRLVTLAGFAEKAMGNIGAQAGGAAKFQAQFGFSILDSSGKVKDFNTLLLTFSDYYAKNANKAQAAAAAAKLFGRGYADLVPILSLGSAKIAELEKQAADLGLTLNATNVKDLAAFKTATRDLGDAVGGLELQIGLALIPTLKDLATAASAFVSGHRGDIVAFFKNIVAVGKQVVGTVGNIASQVRGFWNGLPPELRDLLVKGVVADRTMKFLFGFSPIGGLLSGLESAIAKAVGQGVGSSIIGAGLGKAFVQPVFVTNPGFGGGGGLPGAAVGAAEGAAGVGIGSVVLAAASVTAIGAAVVGGMYYGLPALAKALWGEGTPPTARTVTGGGLAGSTFTTQQINQMYGGSSGMMAAFLANSQANSMNPSMPQPAGGGGSMNPSMPQPMSSIVAAIRNLHRPLDALHQDFAKQIGALKTATDPRKVASAAASVVKDLMKGVGNVGTTTGALAALKTQLRNTHDPTLQAALKADIAKVENKLAARRVVEAQLQKAQEIAKSTESTKAKITDLKAIETRLLGTGNATAARQVGQLERIAAKKSSFTVNTVNQISTSVSVSARDIAQHLQARSRYVTHSGLQAI